MWSANAGWTIAAALQASQSAISVGTVGGRSSIPGFLLVVTIQACFVVGTNGANSTRDREVAGAIEAIRERGRDSWAVHTILHGMERHDPNLLHEVLVRHIEDIDPFLHGPALGSLCKKYGSLPRKRLPLHIGLDQRGQMQAMLEARAHRLLSKLDGKSYHVVAVTDGEHTFDQGDLGIWAAGAVSSRCWVHAAMGGLDPWGALAVVLDSGTDNAELHTREEYGGRQRSRVRGEVAESTWQELLAATAASLPAALVHLDIPFPSPKLSRVLSAAAERQAVFNEALEGAATVTLAALLAVTRVRYGDKHDYQMDQVYRPPISVLRKETFLIHASQSVGEAIGELLVASMASVGIPDGVARQTIWLFDPVDGLYSTEGGHHRGSKFLRSLPVALRGEPSLAAAINVTGTTVLIGASRVRGAFDPPALLALHGNAKQPVVIVLAHSDSSAECRPEDVWHRGVGNGSALFLGGSDPQPFRPFPADSFALLPSRASAMFVYPAISLAVYVSGARRVTVRMLLAAAEALARMSSVRRLQTSALFPPVSDLRDVTVRMALHVIEAAVRDGVTTKPVPSDYTSLLAHIQACQHRTDSVSWRPYQPPRHAALVTALPPAYEASLEVVRPWEVDDH